MKKKLEEDSAEKEDKEINSDNRDLSAKDKKSSIQVQNKSTGEKKNQEKTKMRKENTKTKMEKNQTKEYTQTTLNSFNQNLDELGNVLEIDNRDVLLEKITKAIKKMKKELDKDFITEDARLYKEILELEEN